VKRQGFEVTYDPRRRGDGKGVVDLEVPAVFTYKVGKQFSAKSVSGMQVNHFSAYPFASRKDGGPRDEFERYALDRLTRNPDQPVYQFEDFQGRPVLRYAIARRMKASCINCHNTHPDSPKTDWKEGDVRGVAEIIRPLDRDVARTREGLRGTFVLMAVVSASLLGLSVFVLVVGKRRR
jgi:hypothetical protein